MNESSASSNKSEGRILVLEPDEELNATILSALHEAAPAATVDVARSVEDAQRIVLEDRPDLFVLDMDASEDLGQDFLLDLRTSHPRARAIILTEVHLPAQRQQAAGIGAIHFLEKPFPHSDFVDLVQALLRPDQAEESEKFQGTLSDLHLSDIIQLKCMSGTTTALEFTGPQGEKARVYFDHGQVRHAVAPGREGVEAFNEIVSWKGGKISEVHGAGSPPRTIDMDWQFLLMEAVRKMDETSARRDRRKRAQPSHRQKILVIDDSLMLLSFVQEILAEANYDVITAATAEEGMQATREQRPHLILLDYLLPDLKGDEVSRRLGQDEETGHIPILFMSGFGADLETAQTQSANVFGILNKPFTSDLLLKAIDQHLPKLEEEPIVEEEEELEAEAAVSSEFTNTIAPEVEPAESGLASSGFGSSVFGPTTPLWSETPPYAKSEEAAAGFSEPTVSPQPEADISPAAQIDSSPTGNIYFSGDTNFFSLNLALRTIGKEKLTGVLRCFWTKNDVELYAREGRVALVTTRSAELYCSEAPITLVNLDPERVGQAREEQARTGAPIFLTLAREHAILRDPALQLVQHYGQKLFAQLWSVARVRFVFEQLPALPDFTQEAPPDEEVDHWTLATLRFLQFQDIADRVGYDPACVPAYTREGFERVQNLRLTVAEAQFASQFNGARSVAQIARNLRLDLKFARLTLFRFLALEIVECWPPSTPEKMERGGMLKRFSRSIGIGD